jgi:cytochrome b6-f complex iron-sulfur subunit
MDKGGKVHIRRRDFLGIASLGALGVAMGAAVLGSFRFFVPKVFPEPSREYKIGEPGGFPLGEQRIPLGRSVHIFHDENGFYAVSSKCTHLGCIVKRSGNEFKCPCHGSRFALDGKVISGAAPRPLEWYAMSLAPDGQLVVDEGKIVKAGTYFVA